MHVFPKCTLYMGRFIVRRAHSPDSTWLFTCSDKDNMFSLSFSYIKIHTVRDCLSHFFSPASRNYTHVVATTKNSSSRMFQFTCNTNMMFFFNFQCSFIVIPCFLKVTFLIIHVTKAEVRDSNINMVCT